MTAGRISETTWKQDMDDAGNDEEDLNQEFLNDDDQPLLHSDHELPNKRSTRWYCLGNFPLSFSPPSRLFPGQS